MGMRGYDDPGRFCLRYCVDAGMLLEWRAEQLCDPILPV